MECFYTQLNFMGLLVGACTFLIIGVFHPIVIKGEYYFGKRIWWLFLILGIVAAVATLLVSDLITSVLLGVLAFSLFWAIPEVIEQEQRVKKGWFPRNPKRKYPWDSDATAD